MSKIDDRYLKEFLQTLPKEIPSVLLFHTPSMPKQGDKVNIRLEVEGNLSADVPLMIKFLTQEGDLLIDPIPVELSSLTASFTIPETIEQGSYVLAVAYNDGFLDSITFDIVDEESARQMAEFEQGLFIEEQVSQAIKKGNYDEAINLQEKAVEHFLNANNPELAGRSWEDLAEVLYENNKPTLSKDALEKALGIYSGIKGLENKEEFINRINEKIEICKPLKNKIKFLREKKGYSQAQLAVLVGVTPEIIQKWEERQELEVLIQYFELAQVLDCKFSDLIELVDDDVKAKLPELSSKVTDSDKNWTRAKN